MSGSDFPAGQTRPFHVSPAALGSCVEAWAGYPLRFGGMRRHGWQDELAAELGRALAAMSFRAGESLAGTYTTTDDGAFDAENRLFTNPGASCFPRNVASSRLKGSFVQLSPCDERCLAGEVTITPDARGRHVETSGELFTLRPRVRDTSVRATERP